MKIENAIERYRNDNQAVREYMVYILSAINDKYQKIPDDFIISLDILKLNMDILLKSVDELKEKGVTEIDKYRGEKKSANFQAFFNAQNYIHRILNQFGLTPQSASKIRDNKTNTDIQKYLEQLTA